MQNRKITAFITELILLFTFFWCFLLSPLPVYADTQTGTVTASSLSIRTGPGTSYSLITTLTNGTKVAVTGSAAAADGTTWYKISFVLSGSTKSGYASSRYISIPNTAADTAFETYLNNQGFPESYKPMLRILHVLHPSWVFKTVKVGKNWSDVLTAESVLERNLVPDSSVSTWKSIEPGAYDPTTNTWKTFNGPWVAASKEIIAYSLDPRNFLNEPSIFQFKSLSYDSSIETEAGVERILSNTFMENAIYTYIDNFNIPHIMNYPSTFMEAGKISDVSSYNLAARARQEQGVSGSPLAFGTVSGYFGYFNFFNFGAVDNNYGTVLVNGAIYAKNHGWTNQYLSILGGAKIIDSGYISQGQDTLYQQKFDVTDDGNGLYYHQYMQNVLAPDSEGKSLSTAYSGAESEALVFNIPVYNSMPASLSPKPSGERVWVGVPGSVQAVPASYNSIKVSWGAASGAKGYEVYRSDSSTGTYSLIGTTAYTSLNNTGLAQNQTYYYKIRAYTILGSTKIFGVYSTVVNAKIPLYILSFNGRIGGNSRYDTALLIADKVNSGMINNVLIATGSNYPDAIAAAPLAGKLGTPILLVDSNPNSLNSKGAMDYINAHLNKTGNIYISGGAGAVPDSFIVKFKSLGFNNVIRVSGRSRIDTSVALAERVGAESKTAVITTADNYPDAVSISSIAALNKWPVLLTNKQGLSDAVKNYLSENKPAKIYIIGGTGVISDTVANQVKSLTGCTPVRYGGSNRYDTNQLIAGAFIQNPGDIVFSTGLNFPDALTSGIYAAKNLSPVMLIDKNSTASAEKYVKSIGVKNETSKFSIVGGTGAVSDTIKEYLLGIK